MERRAFLARATGVVGGLVALLLALPFADSLLGGRRRRAAGAWSRVGPLDAIAGGRPRDVKFSVVEHDAFIEREALRSVWVVRGAAGAVTVFSPVCTHLGCHFDWDETTGHFTCPCHASVFSAAGEVLFGPAPRPLDPLEHKVLDGVLYVRWQRFQPGTPTRIPA